MMVWLLSLFSALIAYLATRWSITLSLHRGVLDVPNLRSSHFQPMPRIGGIGIIAAAVLSLATLALLRRYGLIGYGVLTRGSLIMMAAGLGMAAIGLYDDLHGLKPSEKFLLQFLLAGVVVTSGVRIENAAVLQWGPVPLGILSIPISILWLTGFTNIFNFMDGINGISAVTAASYCGFFFLFASLEGSPDLAAVALVIMGSCVGFLFHNFPQARTFMGDTGSLFLGIAMAFFVMLLSQKSPNPASLVALLMVCSVYLWDGGFTLLRRLRRGENIFQAHRSHLYQRLVQGGLSHAKITCLYLVLHALMGSLALLYFFSSEIVRLWILGFALFVFVVFTLSVHRFEKKVAGSKPWSQGDPVTSSNARDP